VSTVVLKDLGPGSTDRDADRGRKWHHSLAVAALTDFPARGLLWLVTHVSRWVVLGIALVFYPGIGLILPIALHWPTAALIDANVFAVIAAGLVSLAWFIAQLEAARRRYLVQWTTDLRLLMPDEFEWLVGETFAREGWTVRETGRQDGPDGNIDLKLVRGANE